MRDRCKAENRYQVKEVGSRAVVQRAKRLTRHAHKLWHGRVAQRESSKFQLVSGPAAHKLWSDADVSVVRKQACDDMTTVDKHQGEAVWHHLLRGISVR